MPLTKKILIVIADASQAKIFLANGKHNISFVEDFWHPQGRLHERDFTTKEHDTNTCPYEDHKKEQENAAFSKMLLDKIHEHLSNTHSHEACIFAPPKFLSLLRHDKSAHNLNFKSLPKDLIAFDNNAALKIIGELAYQQTGTLVEN